MPTPKDIPMLRLLPILALLTAAAPSPDGLWLNPHHSVAVEAGPCGDRLCGRIVWANGEALSDARDAGVTHLVGTTLLKDYKPEGAGRWEGTVFVPDMGRDFSSVIDSVTADS